MYNLKKQIKDIAIIAFVAAIARAIVFSSTTPILWPDSPAYLRAAVEIAHHGDFFPHEIYRTPLYSTFLAIFLWFFDHSPLTGSLIILAQQLTGIFSAILIYVVAGRLAQGRIPLLSGIAYALSPLALYYEMTILTESLFVPIFLLTVYHVITILEEDWQTHRGSSPSYARSDSFLSCPFSPLFSLNGVNHS